MDEWGNPLYPAASQGYGDQQAYMTQARAAYGGYPSAMMAGAYTAGGGAVMGVQNMFSALGSQVMPVTYVPPARINVGFHGMYQQQMGLFRGAAGMMGLENVPRGTSHLEHGIYSAGDFGERMGLGAVAAGSTLGGLAAFAPGQYVGGAAGAAIGSLLGPLGTMAGGAIGGLAGGLMTAGALQGGIMSAVGARRDISSFLEAESFRFVGAGSAMSDPRLGGGMSRDARRQASEFIRQRDIADPLMNTEELTQILQGSSRMGLFAGTQDTADFQRKFKDIVENVKVVTKVLHQTLDEGLKTIKDLKGIGIDPGNVKGVVMQADMAGKVAGRTGAEMLSIGMQGAELFRGTGVAMGIGFQANIMNTAALRASRDAGFISQEAIAQLGGEEAAAQRMTASGLMFGQTAFGRGMGGAFFNPAMGASGFNQQAFAQAMTQGGGNFTQLMQQAATNLGSPAALIQYQANQEKFMTEVGKSFGGQGLQIMQMGSAMAQAGFMAQNTGAKMEDAFRLSLKQMGLSAPEVEARIGMIRGGTETLGAGQQAAAATRDKMLVEEASQNFIFNRIGSQVSDKIKEGVDIAARPLNRMVDNFAEGAIRFKEEQLLGVVRGSARGINLSVIPADVVAKRAARVDLGEGGGLSVTAGRDLLTAIQSGAYEAVGVTESSISASGNIGLRGTGGLGGREAITPFVLNQITKNAGVLTMSLSEAERLEQAGELAGVSGDLGAALASGRIKSGASAASIVSAVYGADITLGNISKQQYAKLLTGVRGSEFENTFRKSRDAFLIGLNASQSMGTAELRQLRKQYDTQQTKLAKAVGIDSFAPGVAEALASAAHYEMLADKETDPKVADRLRSDAASLRNNAAAEQFRFGDDVSSMVSLSKSAGFRAGSEEFLSVTAGIRDVQRDRGNAVLAESLEAQLRTEQFDLLKPEEQKSILRIADQIRTTGTESITDEAANTLDRLKIGGGITAHRKSVEALRNQIPGIKDQKKARELLRGAGLRGDVLDRSVQDAMRGDASKVINAVEREFTSKVAGDSGIIAAGGRSSERGDGEAVTAQQAFALQTSINTQTLAVMQGLSAKLGVR